MNIFILDNDPVKCAQYHCDRHVVKMILESAQILSTVCRERGIPLGYKSTHKNHPCTLWCAKSKSNWLFLKTLAIELGKEYTFRYGKVHKSIAVIESLPTPKIPDIGLTTHPRCCPDEYKVNDVVETYRAYYRGAKSGFATWKKREVPTWYKNEN